MKLIQVIFQSLLLLILSGCVVKAGPQSSKIRLNVPVKSIIVLEKEHQSHNVAILKHHPGSRKHCWTHKRHWHCAS